MRDTPRQNAIGPSPRRPRAALALAICLMTLAGCSTRHAFDPYAHHNTPVTPFLIFDRVPGDTFADALPPRADWPASPYGRRVSERIEFQETFIDRQGRNQRPGNEFQRRFITRRSGVIEK